MGFRAACFDRSARTYEASAWIQLLLARRVLARCSSRSAQRIFESGCGTGILTRLVQRAFPEASIIATDLSRGMLAQASRASGRPSSVRFARQDAAGGSEAPVELVERHCPYDLAVSNALVQWLPDLSRHLRFTAGLLSEGGEYVFSTFTRTNLPELNALLAAPPLAYRRFPGWDPGAIRDAASESGYSVVSLDEYEDPSVLPTPLAVLRQLQSMGASRDPRQGGRLTRTTLRELLEAYSGRYAVPGGVSLTWRSCIVRLRARGGFRRG